jgi:hypothetical protein
MVRNKPEKLSNLWQVRVLVSTHQGLIGSAASFAQTYRILNIAITYHCLKIMRS